MEDRIINIENILTRIVGRLDGHDKLFIQITASLSSLQDSTDSNRDSLIVLENSYKYYSDMFYSSKDHIDRLATRINRIELKSGLKTEEELRVLGV